MKAIDSTEAATTRPSNGDGAEQRVAGRREPASEAHPLVELVSRFWRPGGA